MATIKAYTLPPPNSAMPVMRFTTTLSGTDYSIEYRYNHRLDVWILHVETKDGEILTTGQTIKPRRNLFDRMVSPNRPPGQLWCQWPGIYDCTPPTLTDFDSGLVKLRYYP